MQPPALKSHFQARFAMTRLRLVRTVPERGSTAGYYAGPNAEFSGLTQRTTVLG